MDTKVFGYFLAVCRHRNFARAAQELHISPQGLNSSMRRLEAELGVPLFNTTHAGMQLTGYGELVRTCAEQVDGSLGDLRRGIDLLSAHENNVIKLGCAIGLLGYLGERVVDAFNQSEEGAQIVVTDELPDLELEQRLLAGEYDFGLLTNPVTDELVSVMLVDDHQFFWVNVNNRLARVPEIKVPDLDGQCIITMNDEYRGTGMLMRLCEEAGVRIDLRFTGEMIRVYEFARNGWALGLTCRNHIEATSDSTRTVGVPFKALPWGFSVCYRRDRILTDADRTFLDYLRSKRRTYR